jgi:hypothetical protein
MELFYESNKIDTVKSATSNFINLNSKINTKNPTL